MMSASDLAELAFFNSLPRSGLEMLAREANQRHFDAGEFIAAQHDKADHADFLLIGRVRVLLRFDGVEDLPIETLYERGEMLGWSVFRPPFRYTASLRAETESELLSIPKQAFVKAFAANPGLEYAVLGRTAQVVANRLAGTQVLLRGSPPATPMTNDGHTS